MQSQFPRCCVLVFVLFSQFLMHNATVMPVADIQWILASPNSSDTQSSVCQSHGLQPLQMSNYPFVWNETNYRHIVENYLNANVVNLPYGIKGCCSPGLWCTSIDECYTQGFGARFDNYGWLSGDTTSTPVFTCYNATSFPDIAVVISSYSLSEGALMVQGSGFGSDIGTVSVAAEAEVCDSAEYCTCAECSASDNSCPTGQFCLETDHYGNCFASCAWDEDHSCPCDYTCTPVSSETSLCLPAPLAESFTADVGALPCAEESMMCRVPSIYQSRYVAQGNTSALSATVGSAGGVFHITNGTLLSPNQTYCDENADCADGNVCTIDTCSAAGLCEYADAGGCSSTTRTLRERSAPYVYLDFYLTEAAASQAAFVSFMEGNGLLSARGSSGLQSFNLPFSFVYFGNKVDAAMVSAQGAVSLPPVPSTSLAKEGLLFSTATNVIAPWFSVDWSPSSADDGGGVYTYQQAESGPAVLDMQTDAFHVLYFNRTLRSVGVNGTIFTSRNNTFATSIYADGSVRMRYMQVDSHALQWSAFAGLWGALISSESEGDYSGPDSLSGSSRYHAENLSHALVASSTEQGGLDVGYCPISTIACIPDSCVNANYTLQIRWNATESCAALGPHARLELSCEWAGGIARTTATAGTALSGQLSTVSCPVPLLEFADGALVSVDLVVSAYTLRNSSAAVSVNNSQDFTLQQSQGQFDTFRTAPGSKSVFAVTYANSTELARSGLQVRYYNIIEGVNVTKPTCGCSALSSYDSYTCDSLSVCGGDNSTSDCAGSPFGSAYVSACRSCTGGLSGAIPVFVCWASSGGGSGGGRFLSLLSQTVILLMIICCMTFITSSVSFSIRRMMARRSAREEEQDRDMDLMDDYLEVLRAAAAGGAGGAAAARGLSEFECDALGQVVFTHEFYTAHKKAQLEAMHGVQGVPAVAVASTAEADGDIEKQAGQVAATSSTSPPSSSGSCDCPICLMDILEGNLCRALPEPCGHVFHLACIDQWFRQSTNCPLCKRNMRAILEGTDEEQQQMASRSRQPARGGPEDTPTARSLAALERIRTTLLHLTTDRGVPSHHRGPNGSASASSRGTAMTEMTPYGVNAMPTATSSAGGPALSRVAFERAPSDESDGSVVSPNVDSNNSNNRNRGERRTFDI